MKKVGLFKLTILMFLLNGCGGSEESFNKSCFETPECTITETGFVEFIDSVIACNDSQYFFYYGFGHAVIDSDPSPQCSADSNQPRMVTVKTEMELSDYSVYSCELNIIKTIDWREFDTAPPSSAIMDRCVFIGTEKQS